MRERVKILGILNIVMGCLGALAGIVVLVVFGGLAGLAGASAGPWRTDQDGVMAAPMLAFIGVGIALFLFVLSAPSIIGGWALMKFKPWARVLMIVISVLHLFHIPLGTALGIYGLWVLLNDETRRLFQSGGQAYVPAPTYPPQSTYPQTPNSPPPQPPPPAV
ncbi:MAG: hypothetical protein JOY62_05055 [Acidobacteriaceae bacterium]|nr:hypothetical protein [Acidobacteriaceae bacterium]MBV9779324.1 hypothetical protein [Acidobacteriaceae bacterium]